MRQDRQAQRQPQPADDGAPSDSTTQQRPRRIDWMQLATVVAALAAAGGLIFSGWTGYYSVRTAQDQLDQSREDADREQRQQAALVSTWVQKGKKEQTTGFLTNRSLDPIHQVAIGIAVGPDGYVDGGRYRGPKTLLYLGSLPPCSRVTIPAIAVKHALSPRTPLDVNYVLAGVSFVDVHGQRWARVSSGPLEPLKEASAGSQDPFMDNLASLWKVLFGNKRLSMLMSRPGSSHSELDAPERLKDCGAEK